MSRFWQRISGRQVQLLQERGESLATVQKFDMPLEQATTSSLEALKAYSRGDYEHAIELCLGLLDGRATCL